MNYTRLIIQLCFLLLPACCFSQGADLVKLFDSIQNVRINLEQKVEACKKNLSPLQNMLKTDTNQLVNLRTNVIRMEQELQNLENKAINNQSQLQKVQELAADAMKEFQKLKDEPGKLNTEIIELEKKSALGKEQRQKRDSLNRLREDYEKQLPGLQEELTTLTKKKNQLAAKEKELSPVYVRNESLTRYLFKDYGQRVKEVTADASFAVNSLDSLESANSSLLSMFSLQNETVQAISELTDNYRDAGDFIANVVELFSKDYNSRETTALLKEYMGLEQYPYFNEDQRDRLRIYMDRLKNYCQTQNRIVVMLTEADKLMQVGKSNEAADMIRQHANQYNATVFGFVFKELQSLADIADNRKRGSLVEKSRIKQQNCQ